MIRILHILTNKGNTTVLLIEDDPIIAYWMEKTMDKWGDFEITVCDESEEYKEKKEYPFFDIVLCNLKLVDGWMPRSTIENIKKRTNRFIILSGLADDSYYDLYKNHEHILKPFNEVQLKKKVVGDLY